MTKRTQKITTQKPGHILSKPRKGKGTVEPKIISFVAAMLLIILLLFGCTEMTRTQKNLCYSLATKSYAYVPVCETEKSCFEKVTPMFKTSLSAELESELYGIKNHVARSWFFYNQAITETKKIADACKAGNSSSIAGGINQTEFYMDKSFLELDEGMKESFNVINAEESLLSGQKIDLVKEESLYDSLIELRQIVAELNGGPTNSGSYVSYYSAKANEFANSAANKGFTELVEKRPFWLEAFTYTGGTILAQMGAGKESSFAFIWPIFDNALSELESVFYTKQGILALQKFPINEFMKLYSGLGGTDFSALKKFAELQNRLSINQKSINAQQKTLWDSVKLEQSKIEQQILKLNSNSKFDLLAKELLGTEISSTLELEEKYFAESKSLVILRERKAKNELPLGEELFELKKILSTFLEVSKYLGYGENEYLQKLGAECDSAVGEFKDETFPAESENFTALLEDTKYYASKTLTLSGESKLAYCSKFWEGKKQIDLVKEDFALLESQKKDAAKDCFAYLDKVFEYAEFYELEERYSELKKTEVTEESLNDFVKLCEEIKIQTENELVNEEKAQDAVKKYQILRNASLELAQINSSTLNKESDSKINSLLKRVEQYNEYFDAQGNILFDEFLPIQTEVISSMEKTLSDLKELIEEKSIELIKETARIVYLGQTAVKIGTDTNIRARLILNNRWSEVEKIFFIDLNLSNVKLQTDTDCLGEVFEIEKGKTRFLFNSLPSGFTDIAFTAIEHISTLEKDEFIFVSNEESTLKRTIFTSNSGEILRALVETKKPAGAYKFAALGAGNENRVIDLGSVSVEIIAEPLPPNAKIEVYFYLHGVISLELFSKNSSIGTEESRLIYLIKTINTFDNELNASLFLNLPVNTLTKNLLISDDTGKIYSPEIYSGKIVLKNQTFMPKQERNYTLEITLSNTIEYYLLELERQRNEFLLFNAQDKAIEIEEVLSLGQENNPVSLKKLFESNENALSLLRKAGEEKKSAESMRQELLLKIEEAKNSVKQLEEAGLTAEAKKLDEVITKALGENNLETFAGISKAYKEIISVSFSANDSVASEVKKIFEDAKKLYTAKPSEFKTLFEELSALSNNFELVKGTNPKEAQNDFISMKNIYSEMISLKEVLDKNVSINSKLLKEEVKKLGVTVNALLDSLESELYPPERNINSIKFVPPITESRLKTLRLNASEILNSDKSDAEKNEKLQKIKNELSKAYEYLRREAIRVFNNSIDAGTTKATLSSAKEAIDENKFVSALFILSGGSEGIIFGFDYIGLIPIGVILAVAFVLRHKFAKKEKTEESARKIILEEWKD